MTELFLGLLKMSLIGTLFALAVMAVRLVFRKAPKWIFVALWGVVALRLILPFSVESKASVVPESLASGEVVTQVRDTYMGPIEYIYEDDFVYPDVLEAGGRPVHSQQGNYIVTQKDSVEPPKTFGETVLPALGWVWLAGVVLMIAYTGISYLLLKRKMAVATLLQENIWQCEAADMPFVLGVFRPRIYLPYWIKGEDFDYVVAHEQAHITRRDHWWKPFGFFLLSVHWFNPVLWVAYILLCRDIEAACDEKVIGPMDKDHIRAYSTALLNCSVRRRRIAACPLAFGETGVKERIKRVMNYKKPAFWIILIAILIGVVLVICFCTDPLKKDKAKDPEPTESVATGHPPTENQDNTTKPIAPQTDYPKIEEIKYAYAFAEYPQQSAVLMWYQNDSKYTVTSVQFHFKMKANVSQGELTTSSPCFVNEKVCDPGETADPVPCTLLDNTYLPSVSPFDLDQVHIDFQGNDGRIYTVVYTAQDHTYVLQKETKPARAWTTKPFTKVTPMPNTRFITVNRNNNDYYQFTAYDMTYEQYREYCSQCQTAGFTNGVADNDMSFTCTDARGLTLNILYHSEKSAVVVAATSNTEGKNDQLIDEPEPPRPSNEEIISWYAPDLSGPVSQYIQADNSQSVIYRQDYYKYDTVIPIFMPIIRLPGEDAIAWQANLATELEWELRLIEQDYTHKTSPSIKYITFEAYLNGDILSIVVDCHTPHGGYSWYYTYNFDITTGKQLSKEALIEKLQITDFDARLKQTAQKGFETKWGPVGDAESDYGSKKIERLNSTLYPANLDKAQLYVGQDGQLMTVIYIYAMAGGTGYDELVPFS